MARVAFSYSTSSGYLNKLNPLFKLILLISFTIVTSRALDAELLVLTLFLIAITLSSRINIFKELLKAKLLLLLSVLIVMTEYANTHSVLLALFEGLRYLDLIALALTLSITTDVNELSIALSNALHPFVGKYAYRFSASVMLTLQLIPMIAASASEMLDARRSRGGRFIAHPIKNTSEYVISLMMIILRRLENFGDALDARSFDRDKKRGCSRVSISDILILIIGIAICVTLSIMRKLS